VNQISADIPERCPMEYLKGISIIGGMVACLVIYLIYVNITGSDSRQYGYSTDKQC